MAEGRASILRMVGRFSFIIKYIIVFPIFRCAFLPLVLSFSERRVTPTFAFSSLLHFWEPHLDILDISLGP